MKKAHSDVNDPDATHTRGKLREWSEKLRKCTKLHSLTHTHTVKILMFLLIFAKREASTTTSRQHFLVFLLFLPSLTPSVSRSLSHSLTPLKWMRFECVSENFVVESVEHVQNFHSFFFFFFRVADVRNFKWESERKRDENMREGWKFIEENLSEVQRDLSDISWLEKLNFWRIFYFSWFLISTWKLVIFNLKTMKLWCKIFRAWKAKKQLN